MSEKKLVMAGKRMNDKRMGEIKTDEHHSRGTFTGELGERVEVNFTVEQKAKLVGKAAAIGMPLAVYIRMAAIERAEKK